MTGGHAAVLRAIERRVLREVWVGRRRRLAGVALVALLAAAPVLQWAQSHRGLSLVSGAASVAFTFAALVSALALWRRQFTLCCAAAYISALATVIGLGDFWWHRTGQPSQTLAAPVLGSLAAAGLVAVWLSVVLAPVGRSQPDIRFSRGTGS